MTVAGRAFAVAGATVFAAALAFFGISYAVTFGRPAAGPLATADLAWDALLLAAFALHHSAFARLPVRRWIARRLGPELERPAYVWTASLLLIGVCAAWRALPGVAWTAAAPLSWALAALQALGVVLVLDAARRIDALELAGLHPSPPPADGAGASFDTRGGYGRVRHPIYLGWCLVVLAATPMTTTRLLFAGLSVVYVLVAIPLEERTLRAVAPDAYAEYARRVPWRLLPGLY